MANNRIGRIVLNLILCCFYLLFYRVGILNLCLASNLQKLLAQRLWGDIFADDRQVGVAYLALDNLARKTLEIDVVPVPLVEVPRRGYRREVSVAQNNSAVGLTLYCNALGKLQHTADKQATTHLIDHRVLAKGLALLYEWQRQNVFAYIDNIHSAKIVNKRFI